MRITGTCELGTLAVVISDDECKAIFEAAKLLKATPVIYLSGLNSQIGKQNSATSQPTSKQRTCIKCGKSFMPRRIDQSACSKACRRKIHAPRHPALSREKTCAICGKAFTDESITNSLKTCSPECQLALKRQTKNRLRGGPTVTRKQAAPAKLARAGTIDRRQMLIDAAKRVGLITEAGSREVEK